VMSKKRGLPSKVLKGRGKKGVAALLEEYLKGGSLVYGKKLAQVGGGEKGCYITQKG